MTESDLPKDDVPAQLEDDLSEVHSFYLYLLESSFGHEIPVSGQIAHDVDALRRFVMLLDMAVTPQMIRNGFRAQEHRKAAGALLRFYAQKQHRRREDRDKLDVVATALFRTLYPSYNATNSPGAELDPGRRFEAALHRIYAGIQLAPPPEEHLELVRRFAILRNEASTFRTFDELIDSGILQRVRNIKQTLGPSFLYPSVLSILAAYNVFFHAVFDRLFEQAASEMRSFASRVQRDGSSMIGDEIPSAPDTSHLDSLDERAAVQREYLRHAAQVRKTIENDRRMERDVPAVLAAYKAAVGDTSTTNQPRSSSAQEAPVDVTEHAPITSTGSAAEVENNELATIQATIRTFVRSVESSTSRTVPLPDGSIELTEAEFEAYRADYSGEKSFRADFASVLVEITSLDARLRSQLDEFQKTRHTPYNWKPHANALAHLLSQGRTIADRAMDLAALARQRGLSDKADALNESIEKIRPRGKAAVDALQSIGPNFV
ncbi:MAG TPA: hypothetical protein VGL89_03585 [Candidatus Koribacter sp.]|jgi:hypothetical protein